MTTLREAAAHWREWFDRGEFDEGAARIQEALNAPGADAPSGDRLRVLDRAHLLAFRRGEPSAAYARQRLDLARKLGDVRGEREGLRGLAREALRAGNYARVAEYAAEGLRTARAGGDRAAEGSPLHLYAVGARLSRRRVIPRVAQIRVRTMIEQQPDHRHVAAHRSLVQRRRPRPRIDIEPELDQHRDRAIASGFARDV